VCVCVRSVWMRLHLCNCLCTSSHNLNETTFVIPFQDENLKGLKRDKKVMTHGAGKKRFEMQDTHFCLQVREGNCCGAP
jgi:hypothetical protein